MTLPGRIVLLICPLCALFGRHRFPPHAHLAALVSRKLLHPFEQDARLTALRWAHVFEAEHAAAGILALLGG